MASNELWIPWRNAHGAHRLGIGRTLEIGFKCDAEEIHTAQLLQPNMIAGWRRVLICVCLFHAQSLVAICRAYGEATVAKLEADGHFSETAESTDAGEEVCVCVCVCVSEKRRKIELTA